MKAIDNDVNENEKENDEIVLKNDFLQHKRLFKDKNEEKKVEQECVDPHKISNQKILFNSEKSINIKNINLGNEINNHEQDKKKIKKEFFIIPQISPPRQCSWTNTIEDNKNELKLILLKNEKIETKFGEIIDDLKNIKDEDKREKFVVINGVEKKLIENLDKLKENNVIMENILKAKESSERIEEENHVEKNYEISNQNRITYNNSSLNQLKNNKNRKCYVILTKKPISESKYENIEKKNETKVIQFNNYKQMKNYINKYSVLNSNSNTNNSSINLNLNMNMNTTPNKDINKNSNEENDKAVLLKNLIYSLELNKKLLGLINMYYPQLNGLIINPNINLNTGNNNTYPNNNNNILNGLNNIPPPNLVTPTMNYFMLQPNLNPSNCFSTNNINNNLNFCNNIPLISNQYTLKNNNLNEMNIIPGNPLNIKPELVNNNHEILKNNDYYEKLNMFNNTNFLNTFNNSGINNNNTSNNIPQIYDISKNLHFNNPNNNIDKNKQCII